MEEIERKANITLGIWINVRLIVTKNNNSGVCFSHLKSISRRRTVYEGSSVLYISSSKAEDSIYEIAPLLNKYHKCIKMKTYKNKKIEQTNE